MTALVEEAVSVGDLVRIFEFQQGHATMVSMTLPRDSTYAGVRVGDLSWPADTILVGVIRQNRPIAPTRDDALEAGDELLFLTVPESESALEQMLSPGHVLRRS